MEHDFDETHYDDNKDTQDPNKMYKYKKYYGNTCRGIMDYIDDGVGWSQCSARDFSRLITNGGASNPCIGSKCKNKCKKGFNGEPDGEVCWCDSVGASALCKDDHYGKIFREDCPQICNTCPKESNPTTQKPTPTTTKSTCEDQKIKECEDFQNCGDMDIMEKCPKLCGLCGFSHIP